MKATASSLRLPITPSFVAGMGRLNAGVVLAAPYLVTIIALHGLTTALTTFHGTDEVLYHYPAVLHFANQLPLPDLARYPVPQTPLFHLLMASIGKVVGFELWRLRLVEVLISYAGTLVLFLLLNRRLGLSRATALVLSLVFALSPYFYGASFLVLTDNLAILFSLVAVERFERFRQTDQFGVFLIGCASVAAAILTRQSTAFMLAVAGLYALRIRLPMSVRSMVADNFQALLAVCVSAVPTVALFLTWHGFVPPGVDPSACGLCSGSPSAARGPLVVQSTELALAAIGVYGPVLFAPPFIRRIRRQGLPRFSELRGPLVGASLCALVLLLWPAGASTHGAGFIWRVAGHFPSLAGSPLVFWVLVPAAGATLWARLSVAPRSWPATVFTGCFLASTLVMLFPWQKYVDPFVLLGLMLTLRPGELARPRDLVGAAALAVGFVVYALSFVV
jgi:hypothetical protein